MLNLPNLPEEGVTTSALRDLVPERPKPSRTRIAVLACCVKVHFPFGEARARYDRAVERLEQLLNREHFEIRRAPEPFEDPAELIACANGLLSEGVAGIVFFHASYTAGEIGSQFGHWLERHDVPVLSWSFPDPPSERLSANSLCCQNFLLNMWQRLGVKYAWMHVPIEGAIEEPLARFGRTVRARERFSGARVLHAGGSRVPAFYDGETDELAVMRRFGVRFDRIDLSAVHAEASGFSGNAVKELLRVLTEDPRMGKRDVPDEQALRTLRFALALWKMGAEGDYLGCTFKSWPELFEHFGCAIDGAVSMLNDAGFCTAEEGEMNGILSSLALHLLSEGRSVPTMMDLSAYDSAENRIGIWHCGACPTRILRSGTKYDLTRHSILENGDRESAVGMMIEFLLELGPVTVARYQSPDAARMFAFEGELVNTEMPFRGAWCLMAPRSPMTADAIMGTILNRGLDHHWSLGYGHLVADLEMLNHWIGVESIPADTEQTGPSGLSG